MPGYRKAYGQHVGRFLSCMKDFQRGSVAKRFDPPPGADQAASYAVGHLLRAVLSDAAVQKRYAHVLAKGVLEGNDLMFLRDRVDEVAKRDLLPATVDSNEVAARVHMHLRTRLSAEAATI